ncbi:MAG: Fic family protein [Oscillospiraceae bacterium]|jgi:Fic family protein|nr:Fic family protein [Oscillospiraceae bacterium]
MSDFNHINKLYTELKSLRPLSSGALHRLSEDFMIYNTYHSNAIEGSTLTHDETYLVIKEGLTVDGKPLKFHMDAVGHKDAYYYIEDIIKGKKSLDENVIKKIHYLTYLSGIDEDRGNYRNLQNYVGFFTPCPPEEVSSRMKDLMHKYNNNFHKMHIIERVAEFHLIFETIHPFVDGNGRTGRLLMNFDLMKEGFPPINVKFSDRLEYYDAFNHYRDSDCKDISKMTELVAKYVTKELKRYINSAHIAEKIEIERSKEGQVDFFDVAHYSNN